MLIGVFFTIPAIVHQSRQFKAYIAMTLTTVDLPRQVETADRLANEAAAQGDDAAVLAAAAAAVCATGAQMAQSFNPGTRTPDTLDAVVQAIHQNDKAALKLLREWLECARPQAQWVEDELEGGELPPGEWWVVDPMEGNINHVQGAPEWGVSASLVRDNQPVLTAVYQPLERTLFTALKGSGAAYKNGQPMRPAKKRELKAALMVTGQAKPGESSDTYRRIGESITAMLNGALVVRMTVPATFQLAGVASGNVDGFWQYSNVRSGLIAGSLLVAESGGTVTDLHGRPWTLASEHFLASAPGVHQQAVEVLRAVA